MGNCGSKNKATVSTVDYLLKQYPQCLGFLELSPWSKELAESFTLCDKNNSQTLSIAEFLNFCKASRTRATVRLFSIFDSDGSGSLDFREIMVTVWHLCTLDHRGLEMLVFDLYNDDGSGELSAGDLTHLMEDCYGVNAVKENQNIVKLMARIEKSGSLSREKFLKFCSTSPQCMKQVIDMQIAVQEHVLGTKVWKQLTKKRFLRTDATYRPENWQALMERIIVLDITSRHKSGAPDASKLAATKASSALSEEDEVDEAAALNSADMKKKGKGGKRSRRSLDESQGAQKKISQGKVKSLAKNSRTEVGHEGRAAGTALAIELEGEVGGVGSTPVPELDTSAVQALHSDSLGTGTDRSGGTPGQAHAGSVSSYRVKNREKRDEERKMKLRQKQERMKNALGNTGKPGIYVEED